MKLGYTLAATLGLAAATFFGDRPAVARADDDPSSQATITATQNGKFVVIKITPNGSQYFINTTYPLVVKLTAKGSGAVDKDKLTNADGHYVQRKDEKGNDDPDHSTSVSFGDKDPKVTAPTGLSGEAKLVVCSLTACGNPTKFTFETK